MILCCCLCCVFNLNFFVGVTDNVITITNTDQDRDPVILNRNLKYLPKSISPRAAWVENLDTLKEQKLGMVNLHPQIWGAMPRTDIIAHNVHWQRFYKFVVSIYYYIICCDNE